MYDLTGLFIKAINYDHPESIPVRLGCLPNAFLKYGSELNDLLSHYEFAENLADFSFTQNTPEHFHIGGYTDVWGCKWENLIDGMHPIVTENPIKDLEDMKNFKAPVEDDMTPHGFMYLRILDLLGFENAMIAFAEESDELQQLINTIRDYNVEKISARVQTYGDIAFLGDDLGMQTGLAIGAKKWRKYIGPALSKIYKVFHDAGKYVYMHTDGRIFEIIPDLHAAGADIINPQYRANGIDNLVRVCKGKIPIDLDLDRQMFPFATPQELKDHVIDTVEKMYLPEGGLGICIELADDVPLENMRAILDTINEYRFYKG